MQIKEWFGEMTERYKLVRDFNKASKEAFILGIAATLLEAKITIGESSYRHTFSKFLGGGLRIKAITGRAFKRHDLIELGSVILDDETFVRKLISLGWDTLEVHGSVGCNGLKWELSKYAKIGGYLN